MAVLLFDVSEPISSIEKRLARYISDHHKPVVLAANKWDLSQGNGRLRPFQEYLERELRGLAFAPIMLPDGQDRRGHRHELIGVAEELYEMAGRRVGTGELNRVLERALQARSPSSSGYRARVKYATPGRRAPADLRALRERQEAVRQGLPALPPEPAARRTRLRGGARADRAQNLRRRPDRREYLMTSNRLLWCLLLPLTLAFGTACLGGSKPEWVSAPVPAASERVLWEVTKMSLETQGFHVLTTGFDPLTREAQSAASRKNQDVPNERLARGQMSFVVTLHSGAGFRPPIPRALNGHPLHTAG